MQHDRARERGFTFVEIVVVVAFFGIIGALAVYAIHGVNSTQPSTACARDAQTVRNAESTYTASHGDYTDEATLVRNGLLSSPSGLHDVLTNGRTYSLISAGPCATQVLSDGFEPPTVNAAPAAGSYVVSPPNALGAWTVAAGRVKVVSTSSWNLPVGGAQSVELNAGAYGAIRRAVGGLVSGNTYTLRFAYAVDPCATKAGVRVQIADLDTSLTVTNGAPSGYQVATTSFIARNRAQLLTFTGSGPNPGCGVVIDDIVVTT